MGSKEPTEELAEEILKQIKGIKTLVSAISFVLIGGGGLLLTGYLGYRAMEWTIAHWQGVLTLFTMAVIFVAYAINEWDGK